VAENCNADVISKGNCTAACANAVTALITQGGCCAGITFLEGARQFGVSPSVLGAALKQACHLAVDIPLPCAPRTAQVALSLSNLRYDYYVAHKHDIDQKVINDVASQAGVDPATVSVTGAAPQAHAKYAVMTVQMNLLATGGTTITTAITTTGDVTAIQSDLQTAQTSGTLSFPSLASLPAAASVDPTAGAGSTPDPGQNTTSGVAMMQPSVLLALLLALVALFA